MPARGAFIIALAVASAAGCGRTSGGAAQCDDGRHSPDVVSPEREVELRVGIYRHAHPRATAEDVEGLRETLAASMSEYFAEQKVLLRIAAENGITAEPDEVSAHVRPLESAIAHLDSGEREDVLSIARKEVLCAKARESLVGKFADMVSDGDVDEIVERGRRLAEESQATNALVRARAQAVWDRLSDGEGFASLAKEFNEADEAPDYDWGTYGLEDFDDSPELQSELRTMKTGEFSRPVEGDNGLVIVRAKAVEGDEASPKYSLDRIFFRLAEDVPSFSREEIRAAVATNRANEFIHRELMQIKKHSKER